MVIETQVLGIIFVAIDKINEMRSEGEMLNKSLQTNILGNLDSLALVNFIVALEGELERTQSGSVLLMKGFDMPLESSPFKSVETLLTYIQESLG
jgi:D-alanine--poly(phosphoribitol) ligase subunit 2